MKVKVNDVELEAAPGTSVIDAVFAAGYDVPYYCSLEYLSPIGACRMCLAKVGAPRKDRSGAWIVDEATGEPKVFYFPNPMATCTTQVMEGMVVDTVSDDIKKVRGQMVEQHLLNHPLDCPVCDKGGACELQDRSYEYGDGLSRLRFDKRHQEKHHELSELITLDRERCIHCKRCVRYFEEVPGDTVLDFIDRTEHTYLGTLDAGLPSNFTGNIADICPVGALLDATSRFRGRNWEYDHTPSTGMDDASGSAVVVDARTGRIERVKAGLNPEVNKTWIDDGTRFGHEYADAPDRLREPLVRRNGKLEPTTWEEATAFIVERLATLSGKDVGIAIRADSTLEEGVGALALAEKLGTGQVDHAPRPASGVIPTQDPATFTDLATADAIFVIGDVTEETPNVDLRIKDALKGVTPPELMAHGVPIADLRLKERMPRASERLTVAAPYQVDLMKHAGTSVRYAAGAEAALFAGLRALADGGEAEVPGLGVEGGRALIERLRSAENAVLVYGGFVLADPEAASQAAGFARAVGAKVMICGPMVNSYGLELAGVLPSHERYGYPAMLANAKALLLSHLDPAQDPSVAASFADKDLVVVHDLFLTETARHADVVLPGRSVYERDGTVVNLEGRALSVRAAPVDAGTSEDFTGVVRALGEALGERLEGRSVRSARRVLKKRFELDLADLPPQGTLLPPKARPASKASVRAALTPVSGNLLITPTMVRSEYLSRNPHLLSATGGVSLRLHPQDADALDLREGETVRLLAGGIRREATVRVTSLAEPGFPMLPCSPDQPVGLVSADLASLERVDVETRLVVEAG